MLDGIGVQAESGENGLMDVGGSPAPTAQAPVRSCAGCGFEFTDGEAEDARHQAVRRRLAGSTLIQNSANDQLIYLLQFRELVQG